MSNTGNYRKVAEYLYKILDDISAADDMAKNDDELYRRTVRRLQALKENVAYSPDGQTVLFNKPKEKQNQTCATCKYYDEGICRRLPPKHYPEKDYEVWPEPYENDWCGEHTNREFQVRSGEGHMDNIKFLAEKLLIASAENNKTAKSNISKTTQNLTREVR